MNFNFNLSSYKKQNGTQSIRLKLSTSSKDIQYIDTGLSILNSQWNTKKQEVKRHPLEEDLNSKLNVLKLELEKLYYQNDGVSAKRLKQIYDSSKKYKVQDNFTK